MENKNDYVENKEVEITGVTVVLVQGSDNIKQIRFVSENDITYKPKKVTEVFEEGLKIEKTVAMERGDIPQIIKDIAKKIAKDKTAKVSVTYNIFNTQNAEGDDVQYRYVGSETTLNKWKIL